MGKLHVIAVSKLYNLNNEPDIFVVKDGKIFSYSPQWALEIGWPYDEKIKQIVMGVENKLLQWTDFHIEDGQEIKARGQNLFIENKKVEPIKRLSDNRFANIGMITSKLYNEFLRSREKEDMDIKDYLKEMFDRGFFSTGVSDIVEFNFQHELEPNDLNNLDKQIIVRTKIEGHKFIINFIKNILHSDSDERIKYCEMFFSRVFLLESQNYIKV